MCFGNKVWGCAEFVIAGWSKVKMLWIWSWSRQWGILLVVISKSCLWWFDSYWSGLKSEKWVANDWVDVSPGLVLGIGGRKGGLLKFSLSNSRRHSANADVIANVKSKISVSPWHSFVDMIFSATSKVQNYQNKTREKSLNPNK